MTFAWDPERYLAYADERGRPFVELVQRVVAENPRSVVDLGCGPGNLTRLLKERWPAAAVRGLDSSREMVARARSVEGSTADITFDVADLRDWAAGDDEVDVLVSNATLQWVPGHLDLFAALLDRVRPGGWFAFQVPGNFAEPSHSIRVALAAEPPYTAHTADLPAPASHHPAVYLDRLASLGCLVDTWETTYLHVLQGEDPVFAWVCGTGARPTLEALERVGLRERFEEELKARLRKAYPRQAYGVVLPFRRIFAVARRPAGG